MSKRFKEVFCVNLMPLLAKTNVKSEKLFIPAFKEFTTKQNNQQLDLFA